LTEYINLVYPNDDAVAKDEDLQELAQFLKTNMPNWRNMLKTRKDVIDFSATLWWVCTGYHSLSFSVRDYESYIPFRPTCMGKPMPLIPHEAERDFTNYDIDNGLPFPKKALLVYILIGGVTD
jgi:hypothetical protein